MTTIIGDHGLFCIGDDDYAAFALAMQCNAQAIDVALSSANGALTGALNRPWVSVVTTTVATIDDDQGGGTIGPGGLIGELIQTTGGGSGSPLVTRNNFPTSSSNIPAGIWLVGSSVNWTFGATTANSYRQIYTMGVPVIGGVANVAFGDQIFRMRDYQGDGGATGALTSVGMIDTRNGNYNSFTSFVSHANVASDMSVAVGNWRLWATYLGSGLAF